MQEETNLDILLRCSNFLPQHLWQQHQVIIVHPDQITILYVLSHCPREQAIDLLVRSPCRLVERNLTGMVMEERPEDRIYRARQRLSRAFWTEAYWKSHCNDAPKDHHQ